MVDLFRNESRDAKTNAQRNLMGRTHYVDDDTLRFHKSRVISTRCTDGGLLFAIVTSDALDWHNTKRGFRYVIFDVFGKVLARPDLKESFRTSEKCEAAMWKALEAIDAKAHTAVAVTLAKASYLAEMDRFEKKVKELENA